MMEKQDIVALAICFLVLAIFMPMIVGGAP